MYMAVLDIFFTHNVINDYTFAGYSPWKFPHDFTLECCFFFLEIVSVVSASTICQWYIPTHQIHTSSPSWITVVTYWIVQSTVDLDFKDSTNKLNGVDNHTMDLWYTSQAIGILNVITCEWENWYVHILFIFPYIGNHLPNQQQHHSHSVCDPAELS